MHHFLFQYLKNYILQFHRSAKSSDNEDEFANFSSVKTNGNEHEEDEFANFSSAKTNGHEDEDEFADFSNNVLQILHYFLVLSFHHLFYCPQRLTDPNLI
jgi:hypothetical protein